MAHTSKRSSCEHAACFKISDRTMQRTNTREHVARLRRNPGYSMVLSKKVVKGFNYEAVLENPLQKLCLTCKQLNLEIRKSLCRIYRFSIHYDGGIIRDLGFRDEVIHPFLRSLEVQPRVLNLTLSIRYFRPMRREVDYWEVSPQFHNYTALKKLTKLTNIRVCMSYVMIADEDPSMRGPVMWEGWERVWLAKSLLYLLTTFPKDAEITFFEQDDKAISAKLMQGIAEWLQGMVRNRIKIKAIENILETADVDESGSVILESTGDFQL